MKMCSLHPLCWLTLLAPLCAFSGQPVVRQWSFIHDGKMVSTSGELSFKKGGRLNARLIRVVGTNWIVLKPSRSDLEYRLAITNLTAADQQLVLEFPELVQTNPGLIAVGRSTPAPGPWLPETLVLSNRAHFYTWDKVPGAAKGTLKVEAFDEARLETTIADCPYDPRLWVVTNQVDQLFGRAYARTVPTSNVVLRAWCQSSCTTYSREGDVRVISKHYICRDR